MLVYLVVAGVYEGSGSLRSAHQPEQNPLATSTGDQPRRAQASTEGQIKHDFPEPRLEEDERVEMQDLRWPKNGQLALTAG